MFWVDDKQPGVPRNYLNCNRQCKFTGSDCCDALVQFWWWRFTWFRLLANSSTHSVLNWSWFLFRKLWTWKKTFLLFFSLSNAQTCDLTVECVIPGTLQLQHSDKWWRLASVSWVWHSRGCLHGGSGTSGGRCGQWPVSGPEESIIYKCIKK